MYHVQSRREPGEETCRAKSKRFWGGVPCVRNSLGHEESRWLLGIRLLRANERAAYFTLNVPAPLVGELLDRATAVGRLAERTPAHTSQINRALAGCIRQVV